MDHTLVLGLLVFITGFLIYRSKTGRLPAAGRFFSLSAGGLIAILGVIDQAQQWQHGYHSVPMQLCDWALFLTAASWLFASLKIAPELAVFWALSGSVQATLTPDLSDGFPRFSWFAFYLTHTAVILSAVYFLASRRVQPRFSSIVRVMLGTLVYAAAAGMINWRFGTNYGYLAGKPSHPSILDAMGPWPNYIFVEGFFVLGFFFLILAFSRFVQRR